jgi:type II secretory pathway pseudopilin PulG
MTLLEVLVALAILSTSAIGLVSALGAALRAGQRAEAAERVTADADRLLSAHSLLSRADLDRRLGERTVGEFQITVQRPEPTLYRIAVAERSAPGVALVVTVVYRPEVPGP